MPSEAEPNTRNAVCCRTMDNNHLTKKEKDFFYNLWLQLLDFVNRKYKVTESVINVANPLDNDPKVLRKVRDKLWENTDVITEFVYNTPSLSFEERKYLHDWEYNSIKGAFVIFQQTEDYAILVRMFGIEKSSLVSREFPLRYLQSLKKAFR